jgi:hypothetical protein
VDSPVAGLSYTSGATSGTTDASGQFTYEVGNTITFALGGTHFPAVQGGAQITPLTVFSTTDATDIRVINLARLLQTLDSDQNPANGITLSAAALTAAASVNITDFASTTFDTQVAGVVAASGATRLVSVTEAVAHLQTQFFTASMLAGKTFDFADPSSTDQPGVITFNADGTVGTSLETWSLNSLNQIVYQEVTKGVKDNLDLFTLISNTGGVITASFVQNDVHIGTVTFTEKFSPLIGSWGGVSADNTVVITFVDDTHYTFSQQCLPTPTGWSGDETGTYTWDPATGDFNATVLPANDHNGENGFSAPSPSVITVANGLMSVTYPGSVPKSVSRIQGAPNSLVGVWGGRDEATASEILITFIDSSNFVYSQVGTATATGHSGIETGTYVWDPATGAFHATVTLDTNGDWGFSAPSPSVITAMGNLMSVAFPGQNPGIVQRIGN